MDEPGVPAAWYAARRRQIGFAGNVPATFPRRQGEPMDAMPLHPKLVHVPIALAILMPVVSAGLLLAWFRDLVPRRTWMVAVALQAILVVSSIFAMRTGEADEETVEAVVAESAIEAHEEAAEVFTWTAAGVLVLFVAGAVLPVGVARASASAATAATLVVLLLGYRVGEAGGSLVYEHGAASAFAAPASAVGETPAALPRGAAPGEDDDD
jgi:uncharacterized membrane protein